MDRYNRESEALMPEEGRRMIMTTAEELRKEGFEKGKQEERIETARKAFQRGLNFETVADIIDLPLEELLAIKKEINATANQ